MCRTVAWVGPKRRCERGFGVEWSVGRRRYWGPQYHAFVVANTYFCG